MTERVLVTGASGFLGAHAVREFREHGDTVIAAGRRAEALPGGERFVGDLAALSHADIPVDVVVHCAGLSAPWGRWRDFERANVTGTAQALGFATRNGARRFVHVSSPSIYAAAADRLDIRESEVDERNRLNSYIRSKIAAERLLRRSRPGAPEIVVIRPRGIIGRGDPSLVPRLLRVHSRLGVPLFRSGRNLIDLTSVENVAGALRLAARTPGIDGEIFNITNGDPRPFRALLDRLLGELRIRPRFRRMHAPTMFAVATAAEGLCRLLPRTPEPPITRYTLTTIAYSQTLDITRARSVLGYQPTVSLDESLASYA